MAGAAAAGSSAANRLDIALEIAGDGPKRRIVAAGHLAGAPGAHAQRSATFLDSDAGWRERGAHAAGRRRLVARLRADRRASGEDGRS